MARRDTCRRVRDRDRRSGAIDTFAVESAEQVLVPWPAAPLGSRERVSVRVRVRDRSGAGAGGASRCVRGRPIRTRGLDGSVRHPARHRRLGSGGPELPRSSLCPGAVSARLYATAHGIYVADLNGRRVSEDQLAPGWTSYDARLRYRAYDVTALVAPARNELDRAARQRLVARPTRVPRRASDLRRSARVARAARDHEATGESITLATDGTGAAPERHPRRRHLRRADHRPPASVHATLPRTDVEVIEPILAARRRGRSADAGDREIPAQRVWRSPAGRRWWTSARTSSAGSGCACAATGGHEIIMRHAEVLEDGELGTGRCAPPRPPTRTSLSGRTSEILEPTFTFHGFRYAEVSGCPMSSGQKTSKPSSSAATCGAPAGSTRPTPPQPVPRERRSGACAATSSTCPPTAHSATSGSAGPATSRSSRRPRRSCSTPPASSPPGSPTSPPSSAGRHRPAHRPRHLQSDVSTARRCMGRCRDDRALGAVRADRRPRDPRAAVRSARAWVDKVAEVAPAPT